MINSMLWCGVFSLSVAALPCRSKSDYWYTVYGIAVGGVLVYLSQQP